MKDFLISSAGFLGMIVATVITVVPMQMLANYYNMDTDAQGGLAILATPFFFIAWAIIGGGSAELVEKYYDRED